MKKYSGNEPGNMSVQVKDYQPGNNEFAGVMTGRATDYIERTDRNMSRDASMIRKHAYKGRYE